MATAAPIPFVGNIVTDPELRFTSKGTPVCSFRWVQSDRVKTNDGYADRDPALFMRVSLFGRAAENLADSQVPRGTRVIVLGAVRQEDDWTDRDGNQRQGRTEIVAEEVAVSSKFHSLTARHSTRQNTAGAASQPAADAAPAGDPWATDPWSAGAATQPATEGAAPTGDPWAAGPPPE